MSWTHATILPALLSVGLPSGASAAPPSSLPDTSGRRVLLISVDGLGDDVLDRRDEVGLEIPNLRQLMRRGTTAEALRTVLPPATFPVHVSMVTGVSPARHGIQANSRFVPEPAEDHPHTFASEVRVPTLFDRAAEAGLTSAAVWWPLTAGGPSELNVADVSGTSDTTTGRHLFHLLRGPTEGVFPDATALVEVTDEERTEIALRFLRERPPFAAVHLTAVDAATVDRALDFLVRHHAHGLRRLSGQGASRESGAFPGAYAVLTAEPDFVIVGVGVTGDIDRRRLLLEPRSQGQHGHDPRLREMEAVLIAAGPGVEEGAGAPPASLLDLAPTIARILGVGGFDGPGRAVSDFGATETP